MKRFSLFLMIVLLVSAIFISCSAEPAADATSVVEVAISLPKALNVDSEADPYQALPQVNSLYWFYTAVKADNGFKTGATGSTLTAIRTDGSNHTITTGLPAVIGYTGENIGNTNYPAGQPFSTGTWRFSFYGYKELNTDGTPKGNPIYQYVCSDTQNPNVTVNYTESESMIGGDANITLEIANDTRVSGKVIIEDIDVDFGTAVDSNATYTLTVKSGSTTIATQESVAPSGSTVAFFSTTANTTNVPDNLSPGFYTLTFEVTKDEDTDGNVYASGEISIHARLGYNVTIEGDLNSLESVAYVQIHNNTQGLPQAQNENVFTISTEEELRAFAAYVNQGNNCAGLTIELANDITLDDGDWIPIGNSARKANGVHFAGTFDGKDHTIYGLTLSTETTNLMYDEDETDSSAPNIYFNEYIFGLFGVVKNATIKNLTLAEVDIKSLNKDIDSTHKLTGENVGALIGYSKGSLTVEDVTVSSGSVAAGSNVAGIIGRAYGAENGSISIKDCTNNANITATNGSGNKAKAAGIVGYVSGLGATVTIEGCSNTGALSSTAERNAIAAGIANYGFNNSYVDKYTVKDNTNSGSITLSNNGPLYAKISAECNDGIGSGDSISATGNTSTCTVTVGGASVTAPLVRSSQNGTEVQN